MGFKKLASKQKKNEVCLNFNHKGPMSKSHNIVPYSDEHQSAFKSLNEAWIGKYFKMEEMDHRSLGNPKEYILDSGGYIAVALLEEEVVGVCALIPCPLEGYDLELAKMGVKENLQGMGIGKALAVHIVEKARAMGAKKLFLESNRLLRPAISLYRKLGFVEVNGVPSPYERSDIQMELDLFEG